MLSGGRLEFDVGRGSIPSQFRRAEVERTMRRFAEQVMPKLGAA